MSEKDVKQNEGDVLLDASDTGNLEVSSLSNDQAKDVTFNETDKAIKETKNENYTGLSLGDIEKSFRYMRKIWHFSKNWFEFNRWVEKSDSKWKYIEIRGKRIYEINGNNNGIYYQKWKTLQWNGVIVLWQFKNGEREWKCVCRWSTWDRYIGQYKNDNMEWKWTYIWKNGDKYVGQFKNGVAEWKWKYIWKNGDRYIGQYKNGNMGWKWTYRWKNWDKYIGQFKNGVAEWKWTCIYRNWDKYIGQFKNDKKEWNWTYIWKNGNKYVGQWKNGNMITWNTYNKGGKKIFTRVNWKRRMPKS